MSPSSSTTRIAVRGGAGGGTGLMGRSCHRRRGGSRQVLAAVARALSPDGVRDLRSCFEEGAIVAGTLSGTSADGIDVVLARMRARGGDLEGFETIAFSVEPFPEPLRRRVRAALDGERVGLREAALLSRDLGRAF